MARAFYSLAWLVLLPFALTYFLLAKPAYRPHWRERFGCFGQARSDRFKPVIWVHAVSVGETRAAQPLIDRLVSEYPGHQLLLTGGTPTGRRTGRELFAGQSIEQRYLPFDHPWFIRRFFNHFKPVLGIIMETELWPNMVHCAQAAGVPLMLANGRLSERSMNNWLRWPSVFLPALSGLTRVLVQTVQHEQRMRRVGRSDVLITGNLKFETPVSQTLLALGAQWRKRLGAASVVVLASSRDGEEQPFLNAWRAASRPAGCLLIIVPRHPERFDSVYQVMQATGLSCTRRSELPETGTLAPIDLLLGDSMGEMFAYYGASDLVVMGGSLMPFGGQNLIEPCASARAVIIGPNTYNFEQVSEQAVDAGAAMRVDDAEQAVVQALKLLNNRPELTQMSNAAAQFTEQHRGATQRTLQVVRELLD